eukprot:CAMPEP_0176498626 /NCGR_PEP_ID=MMETSP0200_2-20121128/12434_1 /TAXON_ID=947934 /ORGANISM="Chaetoceros sp., Strain GSL56" /LENGTH=500 /DNA_ID=CAMNT_0017896871 /DNA_START=55 /DNA_END=1557 /DNA_ORIENTATION=-
MTKSIWILSTGSRGDVQPYIAVAMALKAHGGYTVRFFTSANLVNLPQSFGISTTTISPDLQAVLGQTIEENMFLRGVANGNVNDLTEGIKLLNKKSAPFIRNVIMTEELKLENESHKGQVLPDLCIVNILTLGVAWYLALKHGIPFYELNCSDNTFNPNYASGGLPTPPFQLHYYFMRYLIPIFKCDLNMPILEALDVGLAMKLKNAPAENTLDPVLPRGVMISPVIASVLHPKASSKISFLGSTVIKYPSAAGKTFQSNDSLFGGPEVYHELQAFLASGPKPIYIGWGSMICKSTQHMMELCVHAVHHSKQRAIVLGGWAGLSQEELLNLANKADNIHPEVIEYAKNNILFVPNAPHDWLFPQVSVIVHHGGAGTTTAALRAGVPTIITPLITDQFDYAYVVNQLGCGIGMQQLHKISWEDLGNAIVKVVDKKDMAQRALEIAERMRHEDGAMKVVEEVHNFFVDFVDSGKFEQLWPGTKPSLRETISNLLFMGKNRKQ